MLTSEKFYANYDLLMPKLCEPYELFIKMGAAAIPENARTVCDLGIGTGNFSAEVKKRLPYAEFSGIDLNENSTVVARKKINGVQIYNRDLFSIPLPESDYMISSLTAHHFDTATRMDKLANIAKSAKMGFVNFDLALFEGNSIEDVIRLALRFAEKSFPDIETLRQIEHEMRTKDNPMPLQEQKDLFESLGMNFDIIAKRAPYVVYHAFWPNIKP